VTSADGLLTVIPPVGSGPITVDVIETAEGLGSYELGPDGARFDEPVLVEFRVTAEDLAGGVFGFVESSDGTIEGLHLELDDVGDGQIVRASLNHFSRVGFLGGAHPDDPVGAISLSAPGEVTVGDNVPLSLEAKVGSAYSRLGSLELAVDSGGPDNWLINPPLEGTPPGSVVCTEPGTPIVTVNGLFEFEWWVIPEIITGPVEAEGGGTAAFSEEAQINCVQRTPIREVDRKCFDVDTGLEATGCPFAESVSVSGTDSPSFRIDFAELASDLDVIFSVFMNANESDPILIEHHSDGTTNGYHGLGFSSFPAGGLVTGGQGVETDTGSSYMFTPDFNASTTDDVLVLTIESGERVDGGDRVVTEITIFAEKDGKRSIMLLDIADILSHWFG